MELSELKGVGPKTLEYLNKLNIYSLDDLIRYYPYRYNVYHLSDINNINEEDNIVISGKVIQVPNIFYIRRGFDRLTFQLETNSKIIKVTIFNRGYLKSSLTIGKDITLIGKYDKQKNTFTASDIKLYAINKTEVEPVYHMVSGLKRKTLKTLIDNSISITNEVEDVLPSYINEKYELLDTMKSIKEVHNPSSTELLKKAKLKLKYDELFEFMFKINLLKFKSRVFNDFYIKEIDSNVLDNILNKLPFKLT